MNIKNKEIWSKMASVPRSERFDDVYFSVEDGLAETRHVFLEGNRLPERWGDHDFRGTFVIGETGFGTGLNFLAAWLLWKTLRVNNNPRRLEFISVEKYPVNGAFIRDVLSVWEEELGDKLARFCDLYPVPKTGAHSIDVAEDVRLTLHIGDVAEVLPTLEARVDAWFLDGFKPATNPEMWTDEVFSHMARLSHAGTSFATFTAAGDVRRGLQAAGFEVHKVPGFGRKRDMLTGVYAGGVKA